MTSKGKNPQNLNLESYGIKNANEHWNLAPSALADIAVEKGMGEVAESGALAIDTGEFTGRSPKDRFIVKDDITRDSIWWGDINIPFDPEAFDKLYDKVVAYLEDKDVYVRDAIACADPRYKMPIRAVNQYP